MKRNTLGTNLIGLLSGSALVLMAILALATRTSSALLSLNTPLTLLAALLVALLLALLLGSVRLAWRCAIRKDAQLRNSRASLDLARRELEGKVAQRTAELEQANSRMRNLIERLRSTQAQIVQHEKLNALSSLVAGVAHELNTPIGNGLLVTSTLADQTEAFRGNLAGSISRRELLNQLDQTSLSCELLQRSLGKAASLINSFKLLAMDPANDSRSCIALDVLLRQVVASRRGELRASGCQVVLEAAPSLLIDSYPERLVQVLNQLIDNALQHAFVGQGVRQDQLTLRAQACDAHWACLSVRDNGCGMPPAVRQRVFDPFFSTRLGQQHSGLGMTIVHNVVTGALSGQIIIRAAEPCGTEVEIRLHLAAAGLPSHPRLHLSCPS